MNLGGEEEKLKILQVCRHRNLINKILRMHEDNGRFKKYIEENLDKYLEMCNNYIKTNQVNQLELKIPFFVFRAMVDYVKENRVREVDKVDKEKLKSVINNAYDETILSMYL